MCREHFTFHRLYLMAKFDHDVKRGGRRVSRVSPFPLIPAKPKRKTTCCVLRVLCVLRCDLAKEAGAVRERTDAEQLRQGLADIGERAAGTEVRASDMRTGDEQWHVLAGVIGAGGGR